MTGRDFLIAKNYIKKSYGAFSIVVFFIMLVELVLTVNGLFSFDLERLKLRLYLYSYIFLFVSSLVTFILLRVFSDTDKNAKLLILLGYCYAVALILWATFISVLDCVANGDSGIMVYVMVSISIGVLILVKPVYYMLTLGATAAALLVMIAVLSGSPFSSGFYINFLIFAALAVFINAHNYRLTNRAELISEELERLSFTDRLTSVYNRRRLDEQISANHEVGLEYLFILIDVDDFKVVNDSHGHAVGDECLVYVAKKLSESFGECVYRFGGDEFAVISQENEDACCAKIDKINEALLSVFQGVDLHISAGMYRADSTDTPGDVFINTDRALYKAKAGGKSKWEIFGQEQDSAFDQKDIPKNVACFVHKK